MRYLKYIFLVTFIITLDGYVFGQKIESKIQSYLSNNNESLGLLKSDISNFRIYNQHFDKKLGLRYVYVIQSYNNIDIYNSVATFVIKEDKIFLCGNRLNKNIKNTINLLKPVLSASKALDILVRNLGISNGIKTEQKKNSDNTFLFDKGLISQEDIPVKLMFVPYKNEIRLSWDISISMIDSKHWWSIKIDALTGEELDRVDWVSSCKFNHIYNYKRTSALPPPSTDEYNVYPYPLESPNHGVRNNVIGPYDPTASPFGWHDTDGVPGAEYTITRGNNVLACEDQNGNNGSGASPDGGALLQFNFPLNFNQQPSGYLDAATTNLFYVNNMMHDVWYNYGFTSAAGNFQQNNYGLGGLGSDYVRADSQDGSGMNNANFSTPPDGSKPRMQMFLWTAPPIGNLLTINSPSSLSGAYYAIPSGFGSSISSTPITSDLVIYDDAVPDNYDACELPINASALNGKIVLIRRGTCLFVDKIQRAQDAGAISVIMVNNVSGNPITMGGTSSTIVIPALMISDIDGAALISEIELGNTVNATIVDSSSGNYNLDGDFDNTIIAHEYGHGISHRLTGGASNTNCLSNDEQMGEGWSDWFGLMLTIEPGDQSTDIRGIGTYVKDQPTTGNGIRPAPYSTDFNINGYTYDASNNTASISEPHGVGFVWCTMLWDMTWALIEKYGFDPDLNNGIGGNNIAMHLVIQGLKLQPCDPGFVDGRDAILTADNLLYSGANQCLIWNAFANRGLGYSASQGSANSRIDQLEAFDLPTWLNTNSSTDVQVACNTYTWIDGNTYTSSNTSATHTLTNSVGCDSVVTLNLTINNSSTITDNQTSCDSYTWVDGNTYTSSNTIATHTLTNALGCDSIVTLNLTINNSSTSTDVQVVCNTYTWIDGNTYTSSNTAATHTLTNMLGCDSVVTLNLTIDTVDTGITNNYPVLSANATNSSYQWLDCDSSYAPIVGETSQSFTITNNGNYAVVVTQNGCTDTSACETVNNVGIDKISSNINIHPNPTKDQITIDIKGYYGPVNVEVYDLQGRLLETTKSKTVSLKKYSKGIYVFRVNYGDKTEEVRVLKD